MIETAPADQRKLLQVLPLSRRLAVRIAALAARGVAVSFLVAEESARMEALAALLLRREWLDIEADADTDAGEAVPGILEKLLLDPAFEAIGRELPLAVVRRDGRWLLAAEEELEAEQDGDSPDHAAGAGDDGADAVAVREIVPTGTAAGPVATAGRGTGEGGRGFSAAAAAVDDAPAELERLRVAVFAGASPEEKVAALRQLAFSALPRAERMDLFLRAMAEPDRALAAAAAQGIVALGVAPEIGDAARLLADGDAPERVKAADRLADLAAGADAAGLDAILMSLVGALRDPEAAPADVRLAHGALARSAPALGPGRLCRDDLLRAILDNALRHDESLTPVIGRTLRAIDALQPGWPGRRIAEATLQSHSVAYRGLLFQLSAGLTLSAEDRAALAPAAVDTLLALPVTGDACAQTARFVLREGPAGLGVLADALPRADVAHQSHLVRLLDNALCLQQNGAAAVPDADADAAPPAAIAEKLAEAALALFRGSPRQVRAELLETRIPTVAGTSPALRESLAEAILADIGEYTHWRLAEGVEATLRRLGPAAAGPALRTLGDNKLRADLEPVVNALGHLGRELADRPGDADRQQALDILRALQLLAFATPPPPYLDALYRALGRIAGSDGPPATIAPLIWRTLWTRLAGGVDDAAPLEGLALAADSPAIDDDSRAELARLAGERLRRVDEAGAISAPVAGVLDIADGEDVFHVDPALWGHARLVPAALEALRHLCASPRAPARLVNETADALLDLWERTTRFEIVWGPANNALLTTTLGELGRAAALESARRLRLARALAQRPDEPVVMRALAAILESDDPVPELDRLAAQLMLRVLAKVADLDDSATEERETWLRLLAALGLRGRYGLRDAERDRLAERLVDALTAGLRGGLSGLYRPADALRGAGWLPDAARARLESALSRWTAVSVRNE